ncbi:MAG: zinc ribbon domain-containing protein [Methanobrevibacter sp.]|uniref:zinc ribbon domain-containing protein n=1 Tax=Methanobrevibacter sp. TaxID=66852 RepID=UPI001B59A7E2|nr:zinc ribbon domain-containing protein [Methanobrevibacter sp.]MBP3791929.1 zinc ribbon domain-containing protein [Methanobrevibacter sp.]
MIVCDICGTLNFNENNYCTHCGNKLLPEHICPVCGERNDDLATHCIKCKNQLNPIHIDDFDILFDEYNQNLLANAEISDEEYDNLLSDIFIKADYVDVWGKSTKDKVMNLASVFTECKPKSRGYERGFIFLGNCIFYDDRLEDSVQISTIIHELAHYFLFNIIETLLCSIFKVRPSSTIQSFVWYFLKIMEFEIMAEYCAHTVEGRFIPFGYQNYGSFNSLVENSGFDEKTLDTLIKLGNSFANEIIVYLEKYIDDRLRNEIKLQYRKDMAPPTNQSILLETDNCYSISLKNSLIINMLYDVLKEVSSNREAIEELESIKEGIELG